MQSNAERIAKATSLKDEGNTCFKNNDWRGALKQYHFAWLQIKGIGETPSIAASMMPDQAGPAKLTDDEEKTVKALTETVHLNLAACYLKVENFVKCVRACTTAIEANPKSAKAYFRRCQAYMAQKDVDRAETDIRKAVSLAPTDAAIRKEATRVAAEKKNQKERQAKQYKGMFNRGEVYDRGEGPDEGEKKLKVEFVDDSKNKDGAFSNRVEVMEESEKSAATNNNNNNNNNNDAKKVEEKKKTPVDVPIATKAHSDLNQMD